MRKGVELDVTKIRGPRDSVSNLRHKRFPTWEMVIADRGNIMEDEMFFEGRGCCKIFVSQERRTSVAVIDK